ncbi:MAG TPA: glutamate-1-semialdehyde 2,1-aminomutase [Candidatus Azosocius sp. HAIN]
MFENSSFLYSLSKNLIPGGVNSPVRSFNNILCDPIFIDKGKGPFLFDVDENKYIDYICSWGGNILGHGNSEILSKIKKKLDKGFSYGSNTKIEISFAKLIISLYKSIEMVRMMSSGTEATMTAIRLSRAVTKKEIIIKFNGCYHGHSDSLLVKSGSGVLTHSNFFSDGILNSFVEKTMIAEFNDINSVIKLFENYGNNIACVILEPIVANMNLILPCKNFLLKLRELCDKYSSILIFDEIVTGFRVSLSGIQEKYNVFSDLTCLGKIAGGGFSLGILGGKKNIMEYLSPIGNVYHGGTMAGNPITMKAGYETIKYCLDNFYLYEILEKNTFFLYDEIKKCAKKYKIDLDIEYSCGMFGYKFKNDEDDIRFRKFFKKNLSSGIYLPPSKYETCFLTFSHSDSIIYETIKKIDIAFSELN